MASRKHITQLAFSFTEPEIWRPVVGYEAYYEVSNMGRVRSVNRWMPPNPYSPGQYLRGRVLKQEATGPPGNRRYKRVTLNTDGGRHRRLVHHLVLEAFLGPRPHGYEVNHLDGNPGNNEMENLAYVTHAQNIQHADDTGLRDIRGEKNFRARFTSDEVLLMRRLFKQGMSQHAIARQFGTRQTSVFNIVRRNTWAHLPEEK